MGEFTLDASQVGDEKAKLAAEGSVAGYLLAALVLVLLVTAWKDFFKK